MAWDAERILDRIGPRPDETIDLAQTALALAALDRPRAPLAPYVAHLKALPEAVAAAGPVASAAEAAERLAAVLGGELGYRGDEHDYDDMQNANLMRVIDRKRGLPVSLGILYIHAARACGWHAEGLNFPAHFLIAVSHGGQRQILDPFDGGARRTVPDLRRRLKRHLGHEAELKPEHYRAVSNRDILLRLQNNMLTRAVAGRRLSRARVVLGRMVGIAPAHPGLHREMALLEAHGGAMNSALLHAERYADLAADPSEKQAAAVLLQRLRRQLN